jgi:hypothetical protein
MPHDSECDSIDKSLYNFFLKMDIDILLLGTDNTEWHF